MRNFVDEAKIERQARLARILVGAGLAAFVIGLAISFLRPTWLAPVLVSAVIGLLLSQVGNQLHARWGQSPRMDEIVEGAFKGLDDRYALFHYCYGVDHFLTGPAGVHLLLPRPEAGEITYSDGEWWHQAPKRGLLRRGGLRSMGDLKSEANKALEKLIGRLNKEVSEREATDFDAVMLFVHPDAEVHADDSPVPCIYYKKAKGWIRRLPKGTSLSEAQVDELAREAGFSV
jgi:hypothetical protein